MKTLLSFFALALFLSANLVLAEVPADAKKQPELLLSMSAKSGSYADGKLTLQGVPGVVWFTDRPERKAGHLTLKQFGKAWVKGADNFKDDPPNAALAIAGQEKQAVVELMNPKIEGDMVTLQLKVLEGEIPSTFESASVFLDHWNYSHW